MENTKQDGISSGLVAVAWQVVNGWSSCDTHRALKSAKDDRDRLQKHADLSGNIMAYRVEPLVRLSDAEAIIQQQAERIKELETEFAGCSSLLDNAERIMEQQSAALKLSRDALTEMQDLIEESGGVYGLHLNGDEAPWGELEQGGRFERFMTLPEALAAIDALGELK